MKLLIITSLKEYLPAISTLLKQAEIPVYSVSKTTGKRTPEPASLIDDWFGSDGGDFDSIFAFSFADDAAAEKAIALVDNYNKTERADFPVRAFVLPVESTSQSINNK